MLQAVPSADCAVRVWFARPSCRLAAGAGAPRTALGHLEMDGGAEAGAVAEDSAIGRFSSLIAEPARPEPGRRALVEAASP